MANSKLLWTKAGAKEVHSLYPIHVLHTKVSRTAEALKRWNKEKIRWTVFASNVATQIIVQQLLTLTWHRKRDNYLKRNGNSGEL
jgi:hypothetical protein